MKTSAVAVLAATILIGGCSGIGQSALNPVNWFAADDSAPTLVPEGGFRDRLDNRPAVAEVTRMTVEPVQGGAIVQAVGLPPTQGWWDAELRPEGDLAAVAGELRLDFVVAAPRSATPAGPPRSREVSAGVFVPASVLATTQRITVQGASGARSVTRR